MPKKRDNKASSARKNAMETPKQKEDNVDGFKALDKEEMGEKKTNIKNQKQKTNIENESFNKSDKSKDDEMQDKLSETQVNHNEKQDIYSGKKDNCTDIKTSKKSNDKEDNDDIVMTENNIQNNNKNIQSDDEEMQSKYSSSDENEEKSQSNCNEILDTPKENKSRTFETLSNYQDKEEEKKKRRIIRLKPIERSLTNHPMMINTTEITVDELMNENQANIPRNSRIDLQLLRVIANSNTGTNLGPARVYGAMRYNRNTSTNINYSRLFLCRVVSELEGNKLVYLMESKNTNNNLWKRNPQFRDDGTISIGDTIRILSPLPIKNMMSNQIPMIETRFPAVVMENLMNVSENEVNAGITRNESKAFVLNSCYIDILSSTPEETQCSGLFCDKQRIHEIMERNQGCGCYSMLSRRSNLIIDHSLYIEHTKSDWNTYVEKFSSNRFSNWYLTGAFPSSIRADTLQMTEEYWNMGHCIERAVRYINQNGGWTVIGWYKRGMITDQSMITDDIQKNKNSENQVESGIITYHVCYLRPTNPSFFDHRSRDYKELCNRNYNLTRLQTNNI